ncbi:Efflux transporter, RND family, MFP subunit [Candidatus Sulfotelmatomonas gaucii]|uniref:Efflux transporter, RND family, MFP subunit n=1 Tax=Candidatus Sulfuritelmatomonas gaucii TaxID=2043161 RepID=A0A2N9LMB4_9BACT|nr:Efflux transporter, RND family, MFP subunit [Candidatus Sulfotelmatomonas gaucii]
MNKRLFSASAAGVAFIAALGIASCHDGNSTSEAKAATVPSARVAVAQRGDISQILTLAGQFQPYQVVDVHPKVSGYMKKINVDIGDFVRQGETIAILEVPELQAQLQQTVFQLKQSQEEITRAQHEVKSAEALNYALHAESERLQQAAATRPGLIAQQELDDSNAKDLNSQAQVDAAKSALAAAQQHAEAARAENERVQALKNYTTVTAPIAGVVIWRYADTGALIQGGTNSNDQTLPIVRISQSSLLRLRIPVPEDDIRYVHEGDQLQVRVDAINRTFTGKIVRFTRSVNFETRTMETEVDVDNKNLSIAPGMYANTALQLASGHNVVTIPVDALVINAQQQRTVYVLGANNHVHIRRVQVGLEGSKLAEIDQGMNPGDRVILGGQEKYQENEEVSPLVTTEPASETVHETGGTIDLKADANGGNQ